MVGVRQREDSNKEERKPGKDSFAKAKEATRPEGHRKKIGIGTKIATLTLLGMFAAGCGAGAVADNGDGGDGGPLIWHVADGGPKGPDVDMVHVVDGGIQIMPDAGQQDGGQNDGGQADGDQTDAGVVEDGGDEAVVTCPEAYPMSGAGAFVLGYDKEIGGYLFRYTGETADGMSMDIGCASDGANILSGLNLVEGVEEVVERPLDGENGMRIRITVNRGGGTALHCSVTVEPLSSD